MFSFGEFFNLDEEMSNYSVWELFVFIVIGAAFNPLTHSPYILCTM